MKRFLSFFTPGYEGRCGRRGKKKKRSQNPTNHMDDFGGDGDGGGQWKRFENRSKENKKK